MQLEFSIEKEIEFMNKYALTADEFFLIKLIFYSQEGHPELLSKFFNNNKLTLEIRDLLQNLKNKELILISYQIPEKGTIFNPLDVPLNKNLIKSIYQHSQDLGMELFEAYPPYTVINNRTFSLRNITKSFKNLDDFCWTYGKMIKFDPKKHQEILQLLDEAKNNNWIHSGICDFVLSKGWELIKILQDGDENTLQTMTLI